MSLAESNEALQTETARLRHECADLKKLLDTALGALRPFAICAQKAPHITSRLCFDIGECRLALDVLKTAGRID